MNKSITYPRLFLIIVSAVVLGGLIQWRIVGRMGPVAAVEPPTAVLAKPAGTTMDPIALEAEVVRLKGVAPSASVAMADVGFHFSNLWFAGRRRTGRWQPTTSMSRAITSAGWCGSIRCRRDRRETLSIYKASSMASIQAC